MASSHLSESLLVTTFEQVVGSSFSMMCDELSFSMTNPHLSGILHTLFDLQRCVLWLCLNNGHIRWRINLWTLYILLLNRLQVLNIFKFNCPPTTPFLDELFLQESGMPTNKHLLLSRMVEIVSYTLLRIIYKPAFIRPNT